MHAATSGLARLRRAVAGAGRSGRPGRRADGRLSRALHRCGRRRPRHPEGAGDRPRGRRRRRPGRCAAPRAAARLRPRARPVARRPGAGGRTAAARGRRAARARIAARAARDFARSDALRDELGQLGVEVRDTPAARRSKSARDAEGTSPHPTAPDCPRAALRPRNPCEATAGQKDYAAAQYLWAVWPRPSSRGVSHCVHRSGTSVPQSRRVLVIFLVLATVLTVGVATVERCGGERRLPRPLVRAVHQRQQLTHKDKPQSKPGTPMASGGPPSLDPSGRLVHPPVQRRVAQAGSTPACRSTRATRATADYLWDGRHQQPLRGLDMPISFDSGPIMVFKLNYNPGTTPTAMMATSGPAAWMSERPDGDRDDRQGLHRVSSGSATQPDRRRAADRNVMVNRSTGPEDTWGTPFSSGGRRPRRRGADDISSIIAFGGDSIGVMWTDDVPAAARPGSASPRTVDA